jgi:hypothetical protein
VPPVPVCQPQPDRFRQPSGRGPRLNRVAWQTRLPTRVSGFAPASIPRIHGPECPQRSRRAGNEWPANRHALPRS